MTNYIPKTDKRQLILPGLTLRDDPSPGWLRVVALAAIYHWRHLERFAWQRLDELQGGVR